VKRFELERACRKRCKYQSVRVINQKGGMPRKEKREEQRWVDFIMKKLIRSFGGYIE